MLSLITQPPILLSLMGTLLISFTIHEFSHAWVAYLLGDTTAKDAGRLTLNPIAHLDLVGTLMLLAGGLGWAKPVPVNGYAVLRRTPAGLMLVSIAGPFSNLLLAILAAIPFRMGLVSYLNTSKAFLPTIDQFLDIFIMVNLGLMLFNLLPLAPLDGEKIADYVLPEKWSRKLDIIRPYGPLILIALVMVLPMIGVDLVSWAIDPVRSRLFYLLTGA
jgi:Zn-dependent protease